MFLLPSCNICPTPSPFRAASAAPQLMLVSIGLGTSIVRELAGIETKNYNFNQTSIVTNVTTQRPNDYTSSTDSNYGRLYYRLNKTALKSYVRGVLWSQGESNSGNSGGPLVYSIGEVVGMNTFIMTNSNYSQGSIGIGFAIPINLVEEIVEILKKEGEVDRNYFTGIHIQNIDYQMKNLLFFLKALIHKLKIFHYYKIVQLT